MKIYVVVGYILDDTPQTPKEVATYYEYGDAKTAAEKFCSRRGGKVRQVNEQYFTAPLGPTSFLEARIYGTNIE